MHVIETVKFNILNSSKLKNLKNDNVKFRNCVVILKGLIALLSPCCYYNQPWEVNIGELQYVLEFTLILLHVGNFSVSDNDEQLPLIEECLQSLCLVSLLLRRDPTKRSSTPKQFVGHCQRIDWVCSAILWVQVLKV